MLVLNVKTEYSLLSSLIKIKDFIEYANQQQIKVLAIADSNLYGVMEFYKACKANQIRPIVGLEVIIEDQCLLLYAKNGVGYHHLMKLFTKMTERSLTVSDLKENNTSLVCVLPSQSISLKEQIKSIYPDIYMGYTNRQERLNDADKWVYIGKVTALEENELPYLRYLAGIRSGMTISEVEKNLEDTYFHSYHSVLQEFPQDQKNHEWFENNCILEIEPQTDLLPIYDCPSHMTQEKYLKELCKQGLKEHFGEKVNKVYIDRLQYELNVIEEMGFCNYFLVVRDYIKYAKDHDILVGPGRGSAAGSLVSYCLHITEIDPIKYHLLFERFLNPERITMPDIDVDFEFNRREEVIQYCISKYGSKKVAQIITFGTLGSKQAIRDTGRVMNIPLKVVDYVCHFLNSQWTLRENYQRTKALQDYLKQDPTLMKLYKIALKIEGLKRHTSIHAAGVVMSNKELDEVIPLDKSHDDFYTTAYSMEYLEELGLLKMDFLGLRNLSLIQDVLREINQFEHVSLSFEQIPLEDKQALQIFTDVNTVGIFQFESSGMMQFLRKFRPTTFEDIIAALALFRPGPMNNIDTYIQRKQGNKPIDYFHPDLVSILKPTYGIMIYQEQVMQIANVLAGYSFGEADVLRRAMSKRKTDVMLQERTHFIKRSMERGYSKELATQVYDFILKFAAYGFNRAHSVAYATISSKMAYLKAHYKTYFMNSLLSMVMGSVVKTKEYIYECKLNQIEILRPDINLSNAIYKIEGQAIRYPLSGIRNLGMNTVSFILKEREKGPFKDIFDFMKRIYRSSVNKRILESLIDASCFQSFGYNKKTLHQNLDLLMNYGEIASDIEEEFISRPDLIIEKEYSKSEMMQKELDLFGFYLSNHPITEYKLKYPNTITIEQVPFYFDRSVDMIIYVDHVKEIETKKQEKMAFITGSDELNTVDTVFFPKIYEKYHKLEKGMILHIRGKVEKRYDKYQIAVQEVFVLNELT